MKKQSENTVDEADPGMSNPSVQVGHKGEQVSTEQQEDYPSDYPTAADSAIPASLSHADLVNESRKKGGW